MKHIFIIFQTGPGDAEHGGEEVPGLLQGAPGLLQGQIFPAVPGRPPGGRRLPRQAHSLSHTLIGNLNQWCGSKLRSSGSGRATSHNFVLLFFLSHLLTKNDPEHSS